MYLLYMATWYRYKYLQMEDTLKIFYNQAAKVVAWCQRCEERLKEADPNAAERARELEQKCADLADRCDKLEKERQRLKQQLAQMQAEVKQKQIPAAQPDEALIERAAELAMQRLMSSAAAQGQPVFDNGADEDDEDDEDESETEAVLESSLPEEYHDEDEDETALGSSLPEEYHDDDDEGNHSHPDAEQPIAKPPDPIETAEAYQRLRHDLRSRFYRTEEGTLRLTTRGHVFRTVAETGACTVNTLWRGADRYRCNEAVRVLIQLGLLTTVDTGDENSRTRVFRLTDTGKGIAGSWLRRKPAMSLWDVLLKRHDNPAHALLNLRAAGLLNKLEGVLELDLAPKAIGGYIPDLKIRVLQGGHERVLYIEAERNTTKSDSAFLRKLSYNLEANGDVLCFVVARPAHWDKLVSAYVRRWVRQAGWDSVKAIVFPLTRRGPENMTWSDWTYEVTVRARA